MPTAPIKNENGSWVRNNEQKATRFAEHREKIFQANSVDDTELWTCVSGQ